ncbi:hypothetical protein, partial [Dubosiella newyorkensis]|uniref:hypothetical protein n=1 Tax=Dubosiella newyorkensis TaxID=1862672 RepID=UPI002574390E
PMLFLLLKTVSTFMGIVYDDYHKNMNESIEDILNILENLNLDDLKKEFITFYLESPYFEKTTQSNIT